MTYGTAITLLRRPAPVMALIEDRDTGWRGSEADYAAGLAAMARAEGHRKGAPPSPGHTLAKASAPAPNRIGRPPRRDAAGEILRCLLAAERTQAEVGHALRLDGGYLSRKVRGLVAGGLVVAGAYVPGSRQGIPLALTPAGRAKAEAAR